MTTLADYNPFDPAVLECPYPFYEALRTEARVHQVPGIGLFLVSRYEDVMEALRTPEVFSSDMSKAGSGSVVGMFSPPPSAEIREILARGFPTANTLLTNDPPSHSHYRALVAKAFSPRRVSKMERDIRGLADDLVDAFVDDGEVELVTQFAVPLPLTVIADALGVPRRDLDRFKVWSDDAVAPLGNILDHARQVEIAKSFVEFQHYFAAKIDERRAEPQDDMLTDLVEARVDGKALDVPELLSIVQQMLVAGNETTTKLIGSAMLLLLEHDEAMAAVRADPTLISHVVEEALRLESPVQGMFRVAAVDTELGGTAIPAGSPLVLLYASANRDDDVFGCPADFDLGRTNVRQHLAFGQGPHFCVGAALSRAEARVAFEVLLERLDKIRLGRPEPPAHEPSLVLRGLKELWLAFEPA
jgi:cytochrome P450